MSYARELYLKSLLDKAGSGSGSGTYANDAWLLDNLIGQAPAFSFGTPISKTTQIYIPWTYPKQTRWTSTQLLPNITNFTQYIEPSGNTTPFHVAVEASGNWIRTNDPSFVLVINKNSQTNGFSNITYTDSSGTSYSAYAYSYYNAPLVNLLGDETTQNKITGWYSNPSEFGTIVKTSLTFGGFLIPGQPSEPRNISISDASVNSLKVNWNQPLTPDKKNPGQGQISMYDISYNSVGSSIRYSPYAHPNLSSNGITGLTKIINGLYPDSSYSFQVSATNDTGGKGPYSSIFIGSTTNLMPSDALKNITFTVSSYTNGTINYINYVNNSSRNGIPISSNSLLKQVDITANITVPIHRVNNRGKLGTGTLMKLSAKLNTNIDASVNYTGFPIPTIMPTQITAGFVTINTNSISDKYTNAYDQGFYLNANSTITVSTAGFIARNTQNSISCSQKFTNNSLSDSSANYSFYYDIPITTAPSCSINAITIPPSSFKQVSGIYVLHGTPDISVDTSANNMGNFFYSSPLINYACIIGSANKSKNETDLSNVQSTDISSNGTIIGGNLNFKSSITSNLLSSVFSKTVQVNATANNVLISGSSTSSKSINVITDGPSCTLVYTTLAESILTLSTSTILPSPGYRIWSAPTVNNNCPLLSPLYKDIQYDNSWNISSTNNNGIDATRELQIYNGLFCTKTANSVNAYIDYSSYLYNSLNYSTISSITGNRFASFCWKLPESKSSYSSLSFTINSISPNPTIIDDYLSINGQKIQILYCFQDTAATNIYSQSNFNSVWINANSNVNTVTTATYSNTANSYGYYSAGKGASVSGSSATIGAFIPAIGVPNTVYLYLRICVPMSVSISFGSVTAKLTQ